MSRLRLYTERTALPEGMSHAPILAPFWGALTEPAEWIATLRFDRHLERGREHLELVADPDAADFALLPGTWNHYEGQRQVEPALRFLRRMAALGKTTLVFIDTDRCEPVPAEETILFRTSLYRSRRQPNEFAQPAWSSDLMTRFCGGVLPLREKGDVPVVGFCGLVAPDVRRRALDRLRRSARVSTRFVERSGFFGGTIWWRTVNGVTQPQWDHEKGVRARQEYVDNLLGCDYVVCARGGGNFSHRFYEALICGRIPVFVDTDCVLPFDGVPGHAIDWRRHAVWCDESDVDHVADRVAGFHDALTPDDFVELQRAGRRLWEERLSAHGFFAHLHELLAASVAVA